MEDSGDLEAVRADGESAQQREDLAVAFGQQAGQSLDRTEDRTNGATAFSPKCFLIIHSVAKRHNIGNLLRSATAFGVFQVRN